MITCGNDEGICLLEFTDRKLLENQFKTLTRLMNATFIHGTNKNIDILQKQLNEYFEGKRKEFSVPLIIPGTEFQQAVWRELQRIPYGSTCSYSQQAAALNKPKAVRAVAHANGMNRIAIVIPCHRVIGENGNLTGYSGGIERKKWLIDLEKSELKFGVPKVPGVQKKL
jgi:AraC family transcriptional regulator of adaptative response/methylated-DNA-[protein]-cysteine methyltransferase